MTDDIAGFIGAVTREVRNIEHEGKPAAAVVASRSYDTDIDDLWDAITNPERLPRWFAPVSGELKLGGRYQVQGNASGTITRCEPPREFSLTWEFGGEISWLEVRLAQVGDGTVLELAHTAYVDPERWTEFGPGAVGVGWDLSLYGLHLHLTTGASVDPAEAEAWCMSPEGIEFITGCSDGWAQAAIADGDDPEVASAAGARTTAFYTGQPPAGV